MITFLMYLFVVLIKNCIGIFFHRTLLNEPTRDESMASTVTNMSPIKPVNTSETPKTIKESSTLLNILQNMKKNLRLHDTVTFWI